MWCTLCKKALLFYSHSYCRSRWGESLYAVFLRVTTPPPNDFFFSLNRIRSKLSVGSIQKVSHTHAQWAQIPPLSTNCTGWQFNPHMLRCPWERHWTAGYSPMAGKSNFFQALKTPENDSLYLSFINSVICNFNLSHSCSQKANSNTSHIRALWPQRAGASNCRNPEYVAMLQTGNRLSHIHRVSGSSFPLILPYQLLQASHRPFCPGLEPCLCKWSTSSLWKPRAPHRWSPHDSDKTQGMVTEWSLDDMSFNCTSTAHLYHTRKI